MNKKRGITTILVTLILTVAFSSCDILNDWFKTAKDFIGDPVAETCFLNCGISHNMTISGQITNITTNNNTTECKYIELKPMEGWYYAYNKENGVKKYVYKGHFFYQENLGDYSKGEFWLDIQFVWSDSDNDWTTPGAFTNIPLDKTYWKASGVNLVTKSSENIKATESVTEAQYYAAKEALSKYVIEKHSGSEDTTGITEQTIKDYFEEIGDSGDGEIRMNYIKAFEKSLDNHNPSTTQIEYTKKNGVYTYITKFDGSTLELLIFSGTGDILFYPYDKDTNAEYVGNDGETAHDYMMGMYSYNHLKRNMRKWIRDNYTNIGKLYEELKIKAAEAKEAAN